ncbi:fimbria/pilus chaperone family protein [Bordetella sp. 15P40C-2]|uniref:fimbria/pilus chaperone family protein n=1 Tax=Bordetella sp. 15P40C-2 TaxID=2572246 RepID=UPI001921D4EA|nr:fimbria/pilus chaperone family protein [Bordetella sp. 15P40C-2]
MNTSRKSILPLAVLQASMAMLAMTFGAPQAQAAGMRPETSVVIVSEGAGEASMTVQNTDATPALLYTSIQGIPEDDEDLLIVTPPVARVEGGQSQLVRFIVNSPEPLKTERLRRVIFDGIPPKDNKAGVRINMNFRQNLPLIVRPAGLAVDPEPWKRLQWTSDGKSLTVKNPSSYVVRLSPGASLEPSGAKLNLGRTYILPNQSFSYPLPSAQGGQPASVRFTPATTYGFSGGTYDAKLTTSASH